MHEKNSENTSMQKKHIYKIQFGTSTCFIFTILNIFENVRKKSKNFDFAQFPMEIFHLPEICVFKIAISDQKWSDRPTFSLNFCDTLAKDLLYLACNRFKESCLIPRRE